MNHLTDIQVGQLVRDLRTGKVYDVDGRVMRVLKPCIEVDPAAVFANGFEQP